MPRPQIIVNVSPALRRRGAESITGTAFLAYAGATGPTAAPVRCLTEQAALDADVPAAVAALIGDGLTEGIPEVIVIRATAADSTNVTQAEWTAALALIGDEYGVGQVLIPGVTTAAAHAALLAHGAATNRTPLLDGAKDASAAPLATATAALAASPGAEKVGLIAPWVTVPAAAGTTRDVPGSIIAAALAARGDARVGHANHAPTFTQGVDAGVVRRGLNVTKAYTTAEQDALHEAGVSVIAQDRGRPTLHGWRSVSDDDRFFQLSAGRMAMQLGIGLQDVVRQFLGGNIDGRGRKFAALDGALRGYLLPLFNADALYGDTADDAFGVTVADVNTPETVAARELHAAIEAKLTPQTEKVVIDVVTSIAEGV